MKVLAIMQNQWVKNPEVLRATLQRKPEWRRNMIARLLFAGCRSGKVLKQVFGERIGEIVWEEASPKIGGESSSKFPADIPHIRTAIIELAPDVVLAFGKVASEAMMKICADQEHTYPPFNLIIGPHPAARSWNANVVERITRMRNELESLQR